MSLSAFDLFTIGIGPSSSHTVGPMRAARRFVEGLGDDLDRVAGVRAELFGSLGATGHGHGSVNAVIHGLEGEDPATVDTDLSGQRVEEIRSSHRLSLGGAREIDFDPDADVVMHRTRALPAHPNGMTFTALDPEQATVRERTYYSVGGGFVVDHDAVGADRVVPDTTLVAFPYASGAELLGICERETMSISDVVLANESNSQDLWM